MRLAYLILVHDNPEQVKRLIQKFSEDVYVHVDKKCNINEFFVNGRNIFFIKERVNIHWGRYSMVKATLNLIYEAYKNLKVYDYYILLSGADYLIRSEESLKMFLEKNKEYSFIEYESIENNMYLNRRYKKYTLFERNKFFEKAVTKVFNILAEERPVYNSLNIYKGSQWWCLNKWAVEYIINYIKNNKGIIRYFKYTDIPDEMFFQTIILTNHNLKIINDNLSYIRMNGAHPYLLKKTDLLTLRSSKYFFARKFDSRVDSEILDILDKEEFIK